MAKLIPSLVLILSLLPLCGNAKEISFELDLKRIEELGKIEHHEDHPLINSMWPMTREAFQRLDSPVEHEIFSFTIASIR